MLSFISRSKNLKKPDVLKNKGKHKQKQKEKHNEKKKQKNWKPKKLKLKLLLQKPKLSRKQQRKKRLFFWQKRMRIIQLLKQDLRPYTTPVRQTNLMLIQITPDYICTHLTYRVRLFATSCRPKTSSFKSLWLIWKKVRSGTKQTIRELFHCLRLPTEKF